MKRKFFTSGALRLSYLDFEGDGRPILVCLHGHFGNANMFAPLAEALPDWHVYSLDQRGHGWSDHAGSDGYRRADYIGDVLHFMDQILNGKPFVLLGHSLGGVNAYQVAAKRKDCVRGLIIEDIGAVVSDDLSFAASIVDSAPTLRALGESLKAFGISDARYFIESAYEDESGWHFRFDKQHLPVSQHELNGDWWADFLETTCPACLLHGKQSRVVSDEHIIEMAKRRTNTTYRLFEKSGHTIHDCEPEAFCRTVADFLKNV